MIKPIIFSDKCNLQFNCFETLKLNDQIRIGNNKCNGAKAEKIVEMTYAEIKYVVIKQR